MENVDWMNKKYDFHWDNLDVILGGKSLLDATYGLRGFPLNSREEASRFLSSYGFDYDNPIEQAEVLGNYREAIIFIRKTFLYPENPEGLRLDIPKSILELQDIRDLLMMATINPEEKNMKKKRNGDWACALLKVMHVIAHIDKDLRFVYFADVQKQILDRFYKYVHRTGNEDGSLFLAGTKDDPMRVNLVSFETKPNKGRDSVLLKLLHKPENVADEIFDRVGIRLTTTTKLEAFRAVKYLKDHMIVMPANIKANRSRNTLVDVGLLKDDLNFFFDKLKQGEMTDSEFEERLEASVQSPKVESENPHSSQYYRAIQFTCRQLIKLKNPLYKKVRDLKNFAKDQSLSKELEDKIKALDLKYLKQEIRFFYPYEVQIVDQASKLENEKGRSAHSEYKKSQIKSAMIRVLGDLAHEAQNG